MPTKNPGESFTRISVEEAKEMLDGEEAQAIDVRPPGSWAGGHVAKAMNLPMVSITARGKEIPTDKDILFIDEAGQYAPKASETAATLELKEVFSVEGGMKAWQDAGYETETIS